MNITEDMLREIILEVLREMEAGEEPAKSFKEGGTPLAFKEMGLARAGVDKSEVVIAVPPAFGTVMYKRLRMGIRYGTDEWTKALCAECNKSVAYKEAAKNWEGDMYFVTEPEGPMQQRVIMYFDLWHGECRSACLIADESEKSPAYRLTARYGVWKQILDKKLGAVPAMMTGRLKVKGDMVQIMKMPRVAVELTECAIRVDTEFPE